MGRRRKGSKRARRQQRIERRLQAESEPRPCLEDDSWVEWGGELIWAVGFTSGGAPYGLSEEELREVVDRESSGAGWARAKLVLLELFDLRHGPSPTHVDLGYVKKIGDGLSREIYVADVVVRAGLYGELLENGKFAVLLPRRDADPELSRRAHAELTICGYLSSLDLGFRVPSTVGALPCSGGRAIVRDFAPGVPIDLHKPPPSIRPWRLIGEIAAALHTIDTKPIQHTLPGFTTRRAHLESWLARFEHLPELEEAAAFVREHLPPQLPSALLHGDLLGQNILLQPDEPPTVIDWEYALRGDPAYDLAIVTRSKKRPFGIERGLDKLLDAYLEAGGRTDVERVHVRTWELTLRIGWYIEARAGNNFVHTEVQLRNVQAFMRRVFR